MMGPRGFVELWRRLRSLGLLLKKTIPGSNGLAGGGGV